MVIKIFKETSAQKNVHRDACPRGSWQYTIVCPPPNIPHSLRSRPLCRKKGESASLLDERRNRQTRYKNSPYFPPKKTRVHDAPLSPSLPSHLSPHSNQTRKDKKFAKVKTDKKVALPSFKTNKLFLSSFAPEGWNRREIDGRKLSPRVLIIRVDEETRGGKNTKGTAERGKV